ncbi:DNA methyltransferase [Levilactobacillus brevis]|uniref:DNA methyltransferase n=1 Tax=Levilactobacillus brevis TaxID=1580 RepID=UPI000BEA667C|nr:DNA methyltransferase [Levilactobacillus brevis]MCZ2120544.1 DNA methyltransferase [Levilactobacillus brevis]MCZ2126049.1 DNA methyltransferase [Levilactobacillus brevis]MCZ2210352.1 DNA methyltransferase [Levilactobacillus brevis]MCZ2325837.1 DNA methyltransferase [Levilactobacillus brevis]
MSEIIIKSASRVKLHGEVFTPKLTVDLMLDQPEITAKINNLSATFLEPSAGEGVFLVEILKRRFLIANQQSQSFTEFNKNVLVALSTLYGVEYLEDNVEMLVMNMITAFVERYTAMSNQLYHVQPNKKVINSAKVIVNANMAQGDTLKRVTLEGKPIIFSEWRSISDKKVQRVEYTFDAIINEEGPNKTVEGYRKGTVEQLELFSLDDGREEQDNEKTVREYVPVNWVDIYQQRLI